MKKFLNIAVSVSAFITLSISIFFFANFCKCAAHNSEDTFLSSQNLITYESLYYIKPLTKLVIFDFLIFFLLLLVSASQICLLYFLNRNEIKSFTIDFKERREEKQRARAEAKRIRIEAKRAKLLEQLNELDETDKQDDTETNGE